MGNKSKKKKSNWQKCWESIVGRSKAGLGTKNGGRSWEKNNFKVWYGGEKAVNCYYCKIPDKILVKAWPELKKFYGGRRKNRLEVDRKNPGKGYFEDNCVLACAVCNNAKSNLFTFDEFKKVKNVIRGIWTERLKKKTVKGRAIDKGLG